MPIQLSPEQEQRLQAVVDTGVYPSAEAALDAALAGVENTALHGFEGSPQELEALLSEGLEGEPIAADEAFWGQLFHETDGMVSEHLTRKTPA
ncbi:MAG: hypothetical protein U0Q16_30795 [Bryobacteraceae bacterium]